MGKEIERKFLVLNSNFKNLSQGILYRQGYLSTIPDRTVRIRIYEDKGFITVKGLSKGAVRSEYEYNIPLNDADEMLNNLCERPIIEKIRYKYEFNGFTWEIDEFLGDNEGLVIAEIELKNENTYFDKPDFICTEVTGDPRYLNSNLIKNPFKYWDK